MCKYRRATAVREPTTSRPELLDGSCEPHAKSRYQFLCWTHWSFNVPEVLDRQWEVSCNAIATMLATQ